MIKLSLIVPIYNVELYLNDCLDSIFNQLPEGDCVEVIFINDGSTDNSQSILENYLETINQVNKKNIQIIYQENQGLSLARNRGVRASNAEYVAFLDSDDVLLDGYFNEILIILELNKNIELIKFQYCYFYKIDEMMRVSSLLSVNGNSVIDHDFMVGMLNDSSWYAWLHVYKKNKLLEKPFPKNINFEDALTVPYIFSDSKMCFVSDKYLYGYRKRNNSITSSFNSEIVAKNLLSLKYSVSRFLREAKGGNEYSYILYIFFLRVYFSYLIKHKNYKIIKTEWLEIKILEEGLGDFDKDLFVAAKHKIYHSLYLTFGFYSNYIIIVISFIYRLISIALRKMKIK